MEKRMLYRVEWRNGDVDDERLLHVAIDSPTELFDSAVEGLARMISSSAENYDDLPRGWSLVAMERLGVVYV